MKNYNFKNTDEFFNTIIEPEQLKAKLQQAAINVGAIIDSENYSVVKGLMDAVAVATDMLATIE